MTATEAEPAATTPDEPPTPLLALPGPPDPAAREAKAHHRQLLAELLEPVRTALAAAPAWQRLALVADDDRLRDVLELETGLSVRVLDAEGRRSDDDWAGKASELVVVLASGHESAEQFRARLQAAYAELVPAGRLVLLTDVVPLPGADEPVPLSTSQVLGLLVEATGQGLVLEDVKSVRWGREPVHRGLLVAATSIGLAQGSVW